MELFYRQGDPLWPAYPLQRKTDPPENDFLGGISWTNGSQVSGSYKRIDPEVDIIMASDINELRLAAELLASHQHEYLLSMDNEDYAKDFYDREVNDGSVFINRTSGC